MAGLPLSAAASLAVASAAYLDARYHLTEDVQTIFNSVLYGAGLTRLDKQDKVNLFYRLEETAKNPRTANRSFIAVPPSIGLPGQTEWTYAEAYELILKYARWLRDEHGVLPHEIIAMDIQNRPQFIFVWFALWSLGARPAFINFNLRDTAFIHCVKLSTSRLLLLDSTLENILTEEARSAFSPDDKGRAVETVIMEPALEDHIAGLTPYRAPDEARSGVHISDPAILIYTSGTTGLPKAANVNWGKPNSGPLFWRRLLDLKPDDRFYTSMPLYHSSASILGVCQVIGAACTLIISPKFSPRTTMRELSETKATVLQYIGEMCRYLVSSPATPYDRAHSVRLAFGNGLRPDVWQKFQDRFGIPAVCEFYAATEQPGITYNYSKSGIYRGAIGKSGVLVRTIFPGVQMLIKHNHETAEPWRDPKTGFCTRVPTGDTGELIQFLDAANIQDKFHGYFGNEKASSSKVLRNVFKEGDAYYRTGDLHRRDNEGRWWFVDRIGDTFRWKGENVSTAEVAENLGTIPELRETNVYGVELPHHDGRAGCAAIGLADGTALNDALATKIAAHARKRLPRYAVPLFLRVLKEFEVTGTLKHQKVALRNEGVDPSKTGADEIYWLPPGADRYRKFDKADWDRIAGGNAKL